MATFGLMEDELKKRSIRYERIDYIFTKDYRAVIANYQYARLILFTEPKEFNPFGTKILSGTVIAPNEGELVQELILVVQKKLTVGDLFNKFYTYLMASRVN